MCLACPLSLYRLVSHYLSAMYLLFYLGICVTTQHEAQSLRDKNKRLLEELAAEDEAMKQATAVGF
jgi:hypothetical protein